MRNPRLITLASIASALALTACGGDSGKTTNPKVACEFDLKAGSLEFRYCENFSGDYGTKTPLQACQSRGTGGTEGKTCSDIGYTEACSGSAYVKPGNSCP